MTDGGGRSTAGGQRPLVVVADDFRDGRELVNAVLTYSGFEVREAEDGIDALALVRQLRPALLVLDLALPGIDGWAVASELKGSPQTRSIPILALTAHAEPQALQRAVHAGCDAVMTKPCAPDDLVARVRSLLDATADPDRKTS